MAEMAAEERKQQKNKCLPVIPWMRDPVDISLSDSCPLSSTPFLDPRFSTFQISRYNDRIQLEISQGCRFARLGTALRSNGFDSLFPVQTAVWHETIGPGSFERDLCINSPTGSGKTLAYALPIVQMLSTRTIKCLRALVVLPTRDLAVQVSYYCPIFTKLYDGLIEFLLIGDMNCVLVLVK